MTKTPFCCVHFPNFRLQVAECRYPILVGKPFALALHISDPNERIEALSLAARRLRIPPASRVGDIQAGWPQVPILVPDQEGEERLQHQILSIADSQCPTHFWEHDTLIMDLKGTERLHGPDRQAWARRFLERVGKEVGLPHFYGAVANTRNTAELLARASRSILPVMCTAGQERNVLSKIPLRKLDYLMPRLHIRFRLHQLHTLGDLQHLDRKYLQTKFGAEGEQLYAMSQGLELIRNEAKPETSLPQIDLFHC